MIMQQGAGAAYCITIVILVGLLIACCSTAQAKSSGGGGEGLLRGGGGGGSSSSASLGGAQEEGFSYSNDDYYLPYGGGHDRLVVQADVVDDISDEGTLIVFVCFVIAGCLTYGICLKEISYQRWSQKINAAQAEVISSNAAAAAAAATATATATATVQQPLLNNSDGISRDDDNVDVAATATSTAPHNTPINSTFQASYTSYSTQDGFYFRGTSNGILKFHKLKQQQGNESGENHHHLHHHHHGDENDEETDSAMTTLLNPQRRVADTAANRNHLMRITGSGMDHYRNGTFTIHHGLVSTLTGKCYWVEVSDIDWQQVLVSGTFRWRHHSNNNSYSNNNNSSSCYSLEGRWQSQNNGVCGFFTSFELTPTVHYSETNGATAAGVAESTTPARYNNNPRNYSYQNNNNGAQPPPPWIVAEAVAMPSVNAVPLLVHEDNSRVGGDAEAAAAAVVEVKIDAIVQDAVTPSAAAAAIIVAVPRETGCTTLPQQQYEAGAPDINNPNFQSTTAASTATASPRVVNVRMGYHDPVW